jgi:uncharacterized Zn finger protein
MRPIADLVTDDHITRLATPANLRLGRKVVEEGGVELVDVGPARITARVGGTATAPQRRTVGLAAEAGTLDWSCSCTRNRALFCKHCVAAALALP